MKCLLQCAQRREREREASCNRASMAFFTSSAGTKRVRPWDSCQDVEKLKEMLEDREAEIESFRKQIALEAEGVVKKLQETLQEKDAHIGQLMLEVEKSRAVSAFGKILATSSNVAPENEAAKEAITAGSFSALNSLQCDAGNCQVSMGNVCVNGKKKDGVFCFAQEASKMMKCSIEGCQEDAFANPTKRVVKRCASLQKSKSVAADSEEDIECDKELASDCDEDDDKDGDYTVKKMQEEMSADSSSDDEYTLFSRMQTLTSRATANKKTAKGCVSIDGMGKVGNVQNLRASIQKQIASQMVYRKGLKYRTSKAVAEVPNLSEADVKAILGDELFAKASCKGKFIQVTANDDEIRALFDGSFTKRLRYGGLLTLCDGLKFVFTKAAGVLKVTGVFSL